MRPEETLATYVREVADELPVRLRARVALELAPLLRQDLSARAAAAGRAPDEALALEAVGAFGHPRDVATRYLPDGAGDTSGLILSAVVGGMILLAAAASLLSPAQDPGVQLFPLWWLAPVAVLFSVKSWLRQRSRRQRWSTDGFDRAPRAGMIGVIVAIGISIVLFAESPRIFAWMTGGRQLAGSLLFDPAFRSSRLPWLFAVWIAQASMLAVVAVRGRWSLLLRRVNTILVAAVVGLFLWYRADGPVMSQPAPDGTVKAGMVIIAAFLMIEVGAKLYREIGQVGSARLRAALGG